ncbi:MAG: RimK family alpha-L-glutamate ligase [Brevundimonas sp.]|uniref:ATP-grasp domain-containing protein n=1 Tax=Brevundimonas sp. TaxID=1871086 RepID=UPI00391898F3
MTARRTDAKAGAMSDVLILTPDPDDPAFSGRWREVCQRMTDPLEARGLAVSHLPWTKVIADTGPLAGARLVLPLMVWGYHRRGADWQSACALWREAGAAVMNPPEVLSWNADKAYLAKLAARGAPVVPSSHVERLDEAMVAQALARHGTVIVKPQVSASAYRTLRIHSLDDWRTGEGPEGAAIIQPYLPAIESEGEWSLIFCGGTFSHAITKRPRSGDFRIQPEYGGHIEAATPPEDVREAAQGVLAVIDEPLLYARIDLVRHEGRPCLMEAELIEPDLYLGFDPLRGARFAEAVAGVL